jgi:TPR repeat protein
MSRVYSVFLASGWAFSLAFSVRAAPAPGFDWWFSSAADTDWTNKPLQEIRRAAEAGEAPAQYYLGREWFFGVSGNRDMQESFTWVRRSAEQAYPQAELLLARFYFLGLAAERDPQQGFRWATRAADHDNADAMALLGLNHEFGEGTSRDARKALEWLRRAERAGSRVAPRWMGDFYSRGEAGSALRTNHVEALRCYERAASNGFGSAAIVAANMCRRGLGTPPDSQRAVYWLRHFADNGFVEAMEQLAAAYAEGVAEPRAPEDTPAELIYRAAVKRARNLEAYADRGRGSVNPSSDLLYDCGELCNRYRFGIGTPRDYIAAAQWLWQGYRENLRRVANLKESGTDQQLAHPFDPYLKGDSSPLTTDERLWREGVHLVHDALDQNRAEACHQIAESYRAGSKLTPKNPVLAWAWFNRAANLDYAPSKDAVESFQKNLTTSELRAAQELWLPRPIEKTR